MKLRRWARWFFVLHLLTVAGTAAAATAEPPAPQRDLLLLGLGLLTLVLTAVNTALLLKLRKPSTTPQPEPQPAKKDPEPPPPTPQPIAEPPRPAPAPPPAPPIADFSHLPHGQVGRALAELHQAVPRLAEGFLDQRLRERFLDQLAAPLGARIERFKDMALKGDAQLKQHWLEPDLVSTLDSLAQFLSSAIAERRQGRGGSVRIDEELQQWLYERLGPLCKQEGWFALEPILPYTTVFNPEIHNGVGSVSVPGATRPLVVELKSIGRRHPQSNLVTRKADVIVGR